MSRTELHKIANQTSPPEIDIPDTWMGIIVWAVAKFGIGVIISGVFAFATVRVYEDLTALNVRVLTAFEHQTRVAESNNAAIREMIGTLQKIETEHRKYDQ
jgi:hypothetical protein